MYEWVQGRGKVWKSSGAHSTAVGITCPLVEIGLTVLPKTGKAKAPPATPLATALKKVDGQALRNAEVQSPQENFPDD